MPRLPRFSRRLFPSELPNPPVPMSAHPHRDRLPFRFRTVENNQTSCFSGGSKLRRASRSLSVSDRPIGSRPGIPSPLDAPRVPAESRCRVTVPSKTQCDPDSRRDKWLINLGSARALNEFLSPPSPPPPPIFFAPFYRSFYIPSFPFAVILLAPLIRIVRAYVRTYVRESCSFFLSFSFFLFLFHGAREEHEAPAKMCITFGTVKVIIRLSAILSSPPSPSPLSSSLVMFIKRFLEIFILLIFVIGELYNRVISFLFSFFFWWILQTGICFIKRTKSSLIFASH